MERDAVGRRHEVRGRRSSGVVKPSPRLLDGVLIVELTLRSPIFAGTFERCPEATLTVDAQHLREDGRIQMLVWVVGPEPRVFEAALDDDETIRDHCLLTATAERALYRVEFSDRAADSSVHSRWIELGGSLLEAVGTPEGWELRMRFPDRESIRAFYQTCEEKGVGVTVRSLYAALDDTGPGFGLTEKQRDAVERAFEEGYFDVPRRTNLTELASAVGISQQSFSRRLSRGLYSLVANTVVGVGTDK